MAQPKPYRHFLYYDDSGITKYFVVSGGAVTTTTTKTELKRAPSGWKDYEIGWERGWKYYGLFRSYTTPLKFLKDGAMILRSLAYQTGIESKVQLLVERWNSDSSVQAYETFFIGDPDLSQMEDEFDYVVIPIMENGFIAKLKAREDTPYEYSIDGNPDVQYVYMDGLKLQALLKWEGQSEQDLSGYYNPELFARDVEGTNLYLTSINQSVFGGGAVRFVENRSAVNQDINLKLDYNITVDIDGSVAHDSHFWIQVREVEISTNTLIGNTYLLNSTYSHPPGTAHDYIGTANLSMTLLPDRRLEITYRVWEYVSAAFLLSNVDYTIISHKSDLSLYLVNIYEPSYVPGLYASDVWRYLMNSISADNLGVPDPMISLISDLLYTEYGQQLFITSGDGLRNLAGSKLKITFNQFFTFMNTKFGIEFDYDSLTGDCYLEKKRRVFNGNVSSIYPLIESVTNFKAKPFTSEAFVNLKIGSGTFTYDQKGDGITEITNGKDEFNNTAEWLSPLVRITKTADYVSPIRCDMYGIEFTRINYTGKEISDSSSDNDIFAIHCEADNSSTYYNPLNGTTINYHLLYRTPIVAGTWEIQNIFSPETAFNILFSPARSIDRNGPYFRSLLKFNDNDYLNFQLSGKNNASSLKMITLTGGVIDFNEGAAIQIKNLCTNDQVLFQPVLFEFNTKERINLYKLIESDKYSYIEFKHRGNTYGGYIIGVTSKPTLRPNAKFKLIAFAGTDLTKLIR